LVQRIVPVLIVAVGELGGCGPVLDHHAFDHVLRIKCGGRGRPRNARNREGHDRLTWLPRHGRFARLRNTVLEKWAWVGPQFGCRRCPCQRGLGRALGTGPQADEPLLDGARHRGRLPFPRNDLRTRYVFVPGVLPADNLDARIRLSIGPSARVLNPLARHLVIGANTIFRECAVLSVHLYGALPLIFERDDQLVFIYAPQHAHVPGPVEKHRPQVLGAGRGSVRWRGLAVPTRRLRTGRRQRADCENDLDRDARPNDLSSKGHDGPPLLFNRWGYRRRSGSRARPAWSPT